MIEYTLNNKTYIDIRDLRNEHKDYCKGTRSSTQLLTRKGIKDFIYGKLSVDETELIQTEKLSKKFGSIFIDKQELAKLFEVKQETIPDAPPLITDKDLIFFKDDEGNQFDVHMRGHMTRECIFVKAVMNVFKMVYLCLSVFLDKKYMLSSRSTPHRSLLGLFG